MIEQTPSNRRCANQRRLSSKGRRHLPLACLSPQLLDAILTGRQPADLTVARLTREIDLRVSWDAQTDQLGV